jgi:PAS domain-containing protein
MENSDNSFFAAVLDAMPLPVFIVDEDVRIIEANEAALPSGYGFHSRDLS